MPGGSKSPTGRLGGGGWFDYFRSSTPSVFEMSEDSIDEDGAAVVCSRMGPPRIELSEASIDEIEGEVVIRYPSRDAGELAARRLRASPAYVMFSQDGATQGRAKRIRTEATPGAGLRSGRVCPAAG